MYTFIVENNSGVSAYDALEAIQFHFGVDDFCVEDTKDGLKITIDSNAEGLEDHEEFEDDDSTLQIMIEIIEELEEDSE